MSMEKLHPTVLEFKQFVNGHPLLIKEIRKEGRSWQEYYEKWVLLGEEDPMWDAYRDASSEASSDDESSEKQTELMQQLLKMTEKIDIGKLQKQAGQLSNTISTFQDMLGSFQQSKQPKENKRGLNFFRD